VRISEDLLNICAEGKSLDPWLCHCCKDGSGAIVGRSRQLRDCLRLLVEAAATEANVLLCGETGTGKELLARALHEKSARAQGNFVTVDCTALSEILVCSLLFGHEKGSFTGAGKSCEGLVRQAHCGTLFLDEVGELSPTLQKAFLQHLQERRSRPIGSPNEVYSDFRLVATTNCDLQRRVARGRFRQDLLYRLQACRIELPTLRSRSEDIQPLADYHLDRLCRRHGFTAKQMTPEFIRILALYPWPGNVRELISSLEQALIAAQFERILFPKHLPQHIRIQVARSSFEDRRSKTLQPAIRPTDGPLPRLHELRSEVYALAEQLYLASLVRHARQDVRRACRLSGLSRSRLYSLLKKHRISLH